MRDRYTKPQLGGDLRGVDFADKAWLANEAHRSDQEARERQEGLVAAGIFAAGAMLGVVLYDWTQGMAWAQALVRIVYQVGPL